MISVGTVSDCPKGDELKEAKAYIERLKSINLVMGKRALISFSINGKWFEYDGQELRERDDN